MLPVVEYPEVVQEYSQYFADIFTKPQFENCQRYLTGLITSPNVTITAITKLIVGANDQSALNRFLTESPWDERKLNDLRLELFQRYQETRWKKKGVISIDDVLVHKSGVCIFGVGKLYDHSEKKYVNAQQLVTTHYADNNIQYPIDFRQYFKKDSLEANELGFKTKIELACELVDDSEARGISATTYVMDSWYLCKKLTGKIESYEKDWVAGVKSNRLILVGKKYISIKKHIKGLPKESFKYFSYENKEYWVYRKKFHLHKNGDVQLFVSFDNEELEGTPFILATNRIDMDRTVFVRKYGKRWNIETFYRDTKQNIGLEDCQLRNGKGIVRHWYLVLLAYSLLRLNIRFSKLGRMVESSIETIGDACRAACRDELQALVLWIYKHLTSLLNAKEFKDDIQKKEVIDHLMKVLIS